MITVAPAPGLRSDSGRPLVGVPAVGSAVSVTRAIAPRRLGAAGRPLVVLMLMGLAVGGGLAAFDLVKRRIPTLIVLLSIGGLALGPAVVSVTISYRDALARGRPRGVIVGEMRGVATQRLRARLRCGIRRPSSDCMAARTSAWTVDSSSRGICRRREGLRDWRHLGCRFIVLVGHGSALRATKTTWRPSSRHQQSAGHITL